MCSEEPTEKYWELLAEERRKALADALEENEKVSRNPKTCDARSGLNANQ